MIRRTVAYTLTLQPYNVSTRQTSHRGTAVIAAALTLLLAVACTDSVTESVRSSVGENANGSGNVRRYGAIGDARLFQDGTTVEGRSTLHSDSLTFTHGDIGKHVFCVNIDAGFTRTLIPWTTILALSDDHTVIVDTAADKDTSQGRCAIASQDDTAAFRSAFLAASASTGSQYGSLGNNSLPGSTAGTIYIPRGVYVVSDRIYNKQDACLGPAPSLIGEGRGASIIVLRPDMTRPADGTGVLIQATGCGGATFGHFRVDGMGMRFTDWLGEQDLIRLIAMLKSTVVDIEVASVGNTQAAPGAMLNLQSSGHVTVSGIFIQNNDGIGLLLNNSNGITITGGFVSNNNPNVVVANNPGRSPTATLISWHGGGIDECGTVPCLRLQNADINLNNVSVWGGLSVPIGVDGQSRLWCNGCSVGAYYSLRSLAAVEIAPGGKVISTLSTWRGNGPTIDSASLAVMNHGAFVDAGGNDFLACTGNECIEVAADTMIGPVPAERR